MPNELTRRLTAECVGTFFLLLAVVGSGIMAENLSDDIGVQLLANSFATAGALTCLILTFGRVSGAQFNPVVTLWARLEGDLDNKTVLSYVIVQIAGGISGVITANVIFELDAIHWSTRDRSGPSLWLSEVIATFGLMMVIIGVVRSRKDHWVAVSVAAYIAGAYFFTSSTSFANPAVTLARTFSDTFAGIDPSDAPMFILCQLIGCVLAVAVMRVTHPK